MSNLATNFSSGECFIVVYGWPGGSIGARDGKQAAGIGGNTLTATISCSALLFFLGTNVIAITALVMAGAGWSDVLLV